MTRKTYVYTAIISSQDSAPDFVSLDPNINCFLFTDSLNQAPTPWKTVPLPCAFEDPKLMSGFLKARPDLLFEHDSLVVWVDANLRQLSLTTADIETMLRRAPVAALPHGLRSTVADEVDEVSAIGLDFPSRAEKLLANLRDLGFPDASGLSATMLLARDLSDPFVRQFDISWWKHLLYSSRRDQLSFDAMLWQARLAPERLPLDWQAPNKVFSRVDHNDNPGRRIASLPNSAQTKSTYFWQGLGRSGLPELYPQIAVFPDESWSTKSLTVLRKLNDEVVRTEEELEGNYCYMHKSRIAARTPPDLRRSWKREFLRRSVLSSMHGLEIGFNAGHSALLMLDSAPRLKLLSVDLGDHEYSRPCAGVLEREYPGRFSALWGESTRILSTLPMELVQHIDFVHIDGGHDEGSVVADFRWVLSMLSPGALLLVDDAYAPQIAGPLTWGIEQGLLKETCPSLPSSGENRLLVLERNSDVVPAVGEFGLWAESPAVLRAAIAEERARSRSLELELAAVRHSRSWRLTAPLRNCAAIIRRNKT